MKKILTFIILLTASVFAMTCNAEVKYKGYLNVGGSVTSGDTYQYVMGCDGKIGLTLSTEHGIVFNTDRFRSDGIFFGAGLGFDYVNVALDSFDADEVETKQILSNTVMAVPMYLTIKYIYNAERVSMTYAIRGGYYKWFRGHYVNEEAEEHDYKIPYQGSYMVGFGLGIRFPINDRQGDNKFGINLTFNYDYIGANTKWEDENIANNKVSISVGFDF